MQKIILLQRWSVSPCSSVKMRNQMKSLFNIAGENIVLMFHEMNHVVRGRSSPVLRGEAQPLPLLASLCLVATGQSRIVQPTWGQQPTATEDLAGWRWGVRENAAQ